MVNHAEIKCVHCGHNDADVFALFATNEGTRVQLRCQKCRKQYDIPVKQDIEEWGKYFKPEKVKEVTK